MNDGLSEFFQMVRGCNRLNTHLKNERLAMAFFLSKNDHFQRMEGRLLDLPMTSPGLLDAAERSLNMLVPLLEQPVYTFFHELLTAAVEAARLSSLGGMYLILIPYETQD
jgi:hypothetical protein